MTVGQLEDLPNAEYLQWRAFYNWRAEQERRAIEEAKRG